MQSMTELEREFLAYAVEQAHPFVRECAGAGLTDNLRKVLHTDIERIDSAEFAQWHGQGREEFGVPISAFNNRLMELGSLRLIAGIRFRDRDIRFPFVGVEQCSVPLGTVADSAVVLHDLNAA